MIIYNVTFLVENGDEERFLKWMRSEGLNAFAAGAAADSHPRLTKVVEVPGDPEFARQACSFALQLDFADMASAKGWEAETMPKGIAQYARLFGDDHALSFATIMETILETN